MQGARRETMRTVLAFLEDERSRQIVMIHRHRLCLSAKLHSSMWSSTSYPLIQLVAAECIDANSPGTAVLSPHLNSLAFFSFHFFSFWPFA